MKHRNARKMVLVVLLSLSALLVAALAGCLRVSNGVWYVQSAPLPDGWPPLTPVGVVEVKEYPGYRAATVTDVDAGNGTEPMFMTLFDHIKRENIAMTAPVEMGYEDANNDARMTSMAFLYRSNELGEVGSDGSVRVEDLAPSTHASVGVRGDYNTSNYRKGLSILDRWLSDNAQWRAAGSARYLGYNSPFVPFFARYGEVQVPVKPSGEMGGP